MCCLRSVGVLIVVFGSAMEETALVGYQIHFLLSSTPHSKVFSATEINTSRNVAIKVVKLQSKTQIENFEREWKSLERIQTFSEVDHLVLIHAFTFTERITHHPHSENEHHINGGRSGDDNNKRKVKNKFGILVTEKLDFDMAEFILQHGKVREHVAKHIIHSICKQVATLHDHHFAHLDLKLDNFLLSFASPADDVPRRVIICDFATTSSLMRDVPECFGTKRYSPPEVLDLRSRSGDLNFSDARSVILGDKVDIWCLGVSFFCILCGIFPVSWDDQSKILHFAPVRSFLLDALPSDPSFAFLISQMLSINPVERPSISQVLSHPWFTTQ